MPSRDFTSEDLFSSRMMSMQSSTHSSQMKTVGPAMSLRTSCWLLPQNEQYSVLLESPPLALLMANLRSIVRETARTAPISIRLSILALRNSSVSRAKDHWDQDPHPH